MTNAMNTYDFTSSAEKTTKEELQELLDKYCKKWCYQLEKGEETEYLHWQGRFKLKVKERIGGVIKKFPGCHITITSEANRDNMFYVMKIETRVEGPWSDTDAYIPRDIRAIKELLPWQETLRENFEKIDDRVVDVVVDTRGGIGKTVFVRWMCCHGLGQVLPFCNDYRDLLRMCMGVGVHPLYFIDIPRAITKDRLFQLYGAIETIKGGYAYDERYHFHQRFFDPPRICVFTNTDPDPDLLSRDRWRIWEVQDKKLVKRSTPVCEDFILGPNPLQLEVKGATL